MLSNLTDLDIRLIRIFLAVVDAGGLTPAQSTLSMGQPAISTQLATLEARLGYRLCNRGRAGFELTAKGERFVQLSRKLMSSFSHFASEARNMDKKLVGTVNIGLIGQMPENQNMLLSKAIALFRQRSQMVRFSIVVLPPSELEAQLLTGEIQLAIGYFWHWLPNIEYTPLFVERQVAYCGLNHPLFKNAGNLNEEHIAGYEWAWRSYPLTAKQALFPNNITEKANNMEAIAILILSSHHLGYLPTHFAASYVQQVLIKPLNAEKFKYDVTFHLATRTQNVHDDILRALLEDIREAHL